MPNQRIFLWALLGLVLWLTYQAWQKDYGPKPVPYSSAAAASNSVPSTPPADKGLDRTVPSLPAAAAQSSASAAAASAAAPALPSASTAAQPEIRVVTDVLDLGISLQGGTLKRADLLKYPKNKKDPNVVVRLFEDAPGQPPFVFQSGLIAGSGTGSQPDHLANFSAAAQEYRLREGQKELQVPLSWTDGQGVTVTKVFTFKRSMYAIGVNYLVDNKGQTDWRAASYMQFLRHQEHNERSMFSPDSYAFQGPAIYDGKAYRKLNIEKEEDSRFAATTGNGWLASMQHHFVAAVVPPSGQPYQLQLKVKNRDYLLSAVGPAQVVPAGTQKSFAETVFVGPKLQVQLRAVHPELDRTADYGILYFLAKPLFTVLEKVHGVFGNWGWTIIFVTFLLKLVLYPLSEASGKSMAKMKLMQPRLKAIQERYKDDREQLGKQMMELYKREKINPVSGCLPMVVQIPVFLAFYWVLVESAEMRQAPFILWMDNLSKPDPYFILPAIMAAAMFAQFKMNPTPPDPVQAKIMMIMPLAMSVMFAFFPSGLVLYWVTNTLLTIAQQWNINRRIEAGKKS